MERVGSLNASLVDKSFRLYCRPLFAHILPGDRNSVDLVRDPCPTWAYLRLTFSELHESSLNGIEIAFSFVNI